MIECQVRYTMRRLRLIESRGPLEVSAAAMDSWRRTMDRALAETIWASGCRSWYKTASGRVTNNWPRPATVYQRITRQPRPEAYIFEAGR